MRINLILKTDKSLTEFSLLLSQCSKCSIRIEFQFRWDENISIFKSYAVGY